MVVYVGNHRFRLFNKPAQLGAGFTIVTPAGLEPAIFRMKT